MVHSIELIFDGDTRRRRSGAYRRVGRRRHTQPGAGRPSARVAGGGQAIAPEVDGAGCGCRRLPLLGLRDRRAGAVQANWDTRLVVPTSEHGLPHAEVHRLCGPPGARADIVACPQWTAHVTWLGRWSPIGATLRIAGRPSDGRFAGLRRWDSSACRVPAGVSGLSDGEGLINCANGQLAGSGGCWPGERHVDGDIQVAFRD